MVQVVLTLALIVFGLGTYFYGAYRLSKYGFRLSSGIGWAVLLFPPYTFYFAFKKLEVAGKELPTALASFGLVLAIGLTVMFSYDLQMVFTGQLDELLEEMDVQLLEERPMDFDEVSSAIDRGDTVALEGDEEAQAMAEEIEARRAAEEAEAGDEEGDQEDGDADEDEESDEEEGDEE